MIYRLAVLWEIFSIVVCIHSIYNRKIKLDIETIILFVEIIGILELVLWAKLNNAITFCIFAIIVIYCIIRFKDNFIGAVISTLLMLIVIGIMQFTILLPFSGIDLQYENIRMLLINILVALLSLWVLPKVKIYKLRELIKRREKFIFIILATILSVILLLTIDWKIQGKINMEYFFFTIPAFMFLVWLLIKWGVTQGEKELAQNELETVKNMQEEYSDLLTSVRLREHGFKNHLAALLSIRYTINSYEELVKAQDDYYGKISKENRFNNLLFIGDSAVSGFLYEKFCQAENRNVSVTYEASGNYSESAVPIYYLIEMLGIFIDNAIEAQIGVAEEKRIIFKFCELENTYLFTIMNPYDHVSYAEIESWFLQNKSNKGSERGLGLYYVKKICEEYDASVLCQNTEYSKENWIEMELEIKKADKL